MDKINNWLAVAAVSTALSLTACGELQQTAVDAGIPESVVQTSDTILNSGCGLRRLHNAVSFGAGDAVDLICGLAGKPTSISIQNDPELDKACFATRDGSASVEWQQVCGQRDLGKFL